MHVMREELDGQGIVRKEQLLERQPGADHGGAPFGTVDRTLADIRCGGGEVCPITDGEPLDGLEGRSQRLELLGREIGEHELARMRASHVVGIAATELPRYSSDVLA
jgi:hypothetical protein